MPMLSGHRPNAAFFSQESADFRPQHFTMSASMIGAALVLCNDRPETFGAPDVLEVCLETVLSCSCCSKPSLGTGQGVKGSPQTICQRVTVLQYALAAVRP